MFILSRNLISIQYLLLLNRKLSYTTSRNVRLFYRFFHTSLPVLGKVDPMVHTKKVWGAAPKNLPKPTEGVTLKEPNATSINNLSHLEKAEKELGYSRILPDNIPEFFNSTVASSSTTATVENTDNIGALSKMFSTPSFQKDLSSHPLLNKYTELTRPVEFNHQITRSYVRTGNKPEDATQVTDPKSLINNPVVILGKKSVRHNETHAQTCKEDPLCTQKSCNTLCGTQGTRYAIEHWTHNAPQTNTGVVVPVSKTDYNNNPKSQSAKVYDIPHETSTTQEIQNLTNYTNRPDIKSVVEPHEKLP